MDFEHREDTLQHGERGAPIVYGAAAMLFWLALYSLVHVWDWLGL